ncbi:hypothetical protein B0T16DRAFT_443962 [Cercophora newfieldiana]|uniref:Uncharacterized protein n=1 Tax=Cercophora newfieldiana TaxID=92897 RepID=A0AA39YHQ4_9PEZI|nr:hypothetical protein B0T16DRAFT_443962 [Cercophora newfieldiana]
MGAVDSTIRCRARLVAPSGSAECPSGQVGVEGSSGEAWEGVLLQPDAGQGREEPREEGAAGVGEYPPAEPRWTPAAMMEAVIDKRKDSYWLLVALGESLSLHHLGCEARHLVQTWLSQRRARILHLDIISHYPGLWEPGFWVLVDEKHIHRGTKPPVASVAEVLLQPPEKPLWQLPASLLEVSPHTSMTPGRRRILPGIGKEAAFGGRAKDAKVDRSATIGIS